jgi:hypothetical protein
MTILTTGNDSTKHSSNTLRMLLHTIIPTRLSGLGSRFERSLLLLGAGLMYSHWE